MLNLEELKKDALDFEKWYYTYTIIDTIALQKLKKERTDFYNQHYYVLNSKFDNSFILNAKELIQEQLKKMDEQIQALEESKPDEIELRDMILEYRNGKIKMLDNEYGTYLSETNLGDNNETNDKVQEETDVYLSYLKEARRLIEYMGELTNDYAVANVYKALVYYNDKLSEQLSDKQNSEAKKEAENHFIDALNFIKENHYPIIYTFMLADKLGIKIDVAVALKNKLIDKKVLDYDGSITFLTNHEINKLLNDTSSQQITSDDDSLKVTDGEENPGVAAFGTDR